MSTQRGKTTPASTNGSWSPHSGRSSRVEPGTADETAPAETAEQVESWEAYYDKHGTPQSGDDRAALAVLRQRGIDGWAASLAAISIRPTQMVELDDAGVPLGGHGPSLFNKVPVDEIADAIANGINLYEYDRARSGGRLDSHQLNTPPDHADVISAYNAGANLAAFGLIAGQHRIDPGEAAEAADSRHLPPLSYLALRETSGCSHTEAMEVANAVGRDGFQFQGQSTYDGLRAAGCSHAQIVQALALTPEHDPTGITTLFNYRNLLWEHSHDAAIARLTDAR